ncbi:MAG: ABC transporter permease [Spirochaetaceae bacterium]|jgi:peptide/nickel transport system permease protein|nr:ABC transporter permease [Spirochaetaceae bacterium]
MNRVKRHQEWEQRRLVVNKFLSNKLAVTGSVILLFMLFCALAAPILCPANPYEMTVSDRLKGPGPGHLFGTDSFGRDLLTRVLYGARISLSIGAAVSAAALGMGIIIGLYAAYYRYLDNLLMRLCDSLSAIPSTLLAIALMAVLGAGAKNVIISLSIIFTPGVARIARAAALSVKERTYIEAMRAQGARAARILWLHIFPNILGPIIVQGSYIFASTIISEAALSFLGVGVPIPEPSWGNILYEGKGVIYNSLWMVIFPGAFTVLSVLALNLFGDGLRDVLDPNT